MINKIRRVRSFRSFQNWTPPSGLPVFEAINLIYGINGSGKSTFASLLQNAQLDIDWASGLEVDVSDVSGASRQAKDASDSVWQTIRVFNREYVDQNLSFEAKLGGTAQPLLVLGKANVEQEQQRKDAEMRLAAAEAGLPTANTELQRANKAVNDLLTEHARIIASELGSVGGRYAERSYTARTLRAELDRPRGADGEDEIDIAHELAVVQEQPSPPRDLPVATKVSIRGLVDDVRGILRETATSKALSDLVDHPDWQRWVETGLALHADRDTCIYCEGRLDPERQTRLEAHFDESLRKLQLQMSTVLTQLGEARTKSSETLSGLPREGELFKSLRSEFKTALTKVTTVSKGLLETINVLERALQKKSGSLFTAQELTLDEPVDEIDFTEVRELLKNHNETSISLESHRKTAAERVEKARVARIREQFDALTEAAGKQEEHRDDLLDQQRVSKTDLDRLSHDNFDPQPLAEKLNADLSQLLGREDLKFVVEGAGYRIERDGRPAQHLSEGERNAISLLYFLCSLNSHGTKACDCIVVIDDPVSSLDGNALVGASAHLWEELVGEGKCRQLFLLTHNFELFRIWSSMLDARHIRQDHQTFEIRMMIFRDAGGRFVRRPSLIGWPSDSQLRNRLRSEYHYLFWRVASALVACRSNPTPEGDIEAATVLPNVCRRLLEGFLGFKSPAKVGNLHDQVKDVGDKVVAIPMSTRIYRFIQAYSHNQEADTTRPVGRPEAVEILNTVLEFMREVDRDHFIAMCEAVSIDQSALEAAVVPPTQEEPGVTITAIA
ncbi:MAG: AAA family ATPase [Acidimicrobiales bacterium]|jgi:wobble nucleotide-excising tRNase